MQVWEQALINSGGRDGEAALLSPWLPASSSAVLAGSEKSPSERRKALQKCPRLPRLNQRQRVTASSSASLVMLAGERSPPPQPAPATGTASVSDTDLALLQNTRSLLDMGMLFQLKQSSPSLCSWSQWSLGNVSALNIACNYGLAVSESSPRCT